MSGISPWSAWFHRVSDDVRALVAIQSVFSLSLLTAWGRIDFDSSLGNFSFDVLTTCIRISSCADLCDALGFFELLHFVAMYRFD